MGFLTGENTKRDLHAVAGLLYQGEFLIQTVGTALDFVALTNERIIFVDRTVFGKKKAIISIPYSKIDAITWEKGSFWSGMSRLEIVTRAKTYELSFRKETNVQGFYQLLAHGICKKGYRP